MKLRKAFVIFALLVFSFFYIANAQDLKEIVLRASPAVVRIDVEYSEEGSKKNEQGSGVVVSASGIIFTNKHVIGQQNISKITISITSELGSPPIPTYTARPIYISDNKDFDFGVLQINASLDNGFSFPVDPSKLDIPYIPDWANRQPDITDTVNFLGYPAVSGGNLTADRGQIQSIGLNGSIVTAKASVSVSGGFSGGLVLNDNGEMVGLVFAQSSAGTDAVAPILSAQTICDQVPDICANVRPAITETNPICLQPRVAPYCEKTPFRVGMTAQIGSLESEVQLRGDPIWKSQWIKPLPRSTFVTIVGGPAASLDDVLDGFELFWWQVEDTTGTRGWVVEDYFGEPVLIPSDPDAPTVPAAICHLITRTPANIRSGPGAEYNQIASRKVKEPLAADGQFKAGDNFTWWRLIEGFWVREDAVSEDGVCSTLPVVAP